MAFSKDVGVAEVNEKSEYVKSASKKDNPSNSLLAKFVCLREEEEKTILDRLEFWNRVPVKSLSEKFLFVIVVFRRSVQKIEETATQPAMFVISENVVFRTTRVITNQRKIIRGLLSSTRFFSFIRKSYFLGFS